MLNPSERQVAVERFLSHQTDDEWTKLRDLLLNDMPPRVIVTIGGGNYQGAAATAPVDLAILDFDNWRACDEGHEEEAEHYANLEVEVERLKNDPSAVLF